MLSQHDFSESVVGAVVGGRVCWPCLTSAANLTEVCIRLFVCGCIHARVREKGEGVGNKCFCLCLCVAWRRGSATVCMKNILGCLGVRFNLICPEQ